MTHRRHVSDLLEFSSDESSDEEGLFEKCSLMPVRRMAIIDTCNVMHGCAGFALNAEPSTSYSDKRPDALGILLLAKQLLQEGYDLKMFVPVSYMTKSKVANRFILEQLHRLGFLTVIDDGSHDDLIILEMAKMVGGFVISNDRFRDHAMVKGLQDVIHNRTVRFNFRHVDLQSVGKEFASQRKNRYFFGFRLVLVPDKSKKAMLAQHDDPSFSMAFAQRMIRSEPNIRSALEVMGVMADFIQQEFCDACSVNAPSLEYFEPERDALPANFSKFLEFYNVYKMNVLEQ